MMAKRGSETSVSPLEELRWHVEMGADELIDDGPINRYVVASKPAETASAAAPTASALAPPEAAQGSPRQASGPTLAPAEGARDAIAVAAGAQLSLIHISEPTRPY